MGDINQFFTRKKANEGRKVPLFLPDGSKSDDWLMIRGIDSDAFREADDEACRKAFELAAIEDELDRKEAFKSQKNNLVASLVIGWSFDVECTKENVIEFLTEAPQIADQVSQVARKRALFFGEKLNS